MTIETVKELLDSAETAGHLVDHLPSLPQGLHPRHVRALEKIAVQNQVGKQPLPSDISEILNVTRPGVTRTLHELQDKGYICKTVDPKDNRMYRLSLTDEGWEVYNYYVKKGHAEIQMALEGMDEDKIRDAIATLREAHARVIRMGEKFRCSEHPRHK